MGGGILPIAIHRKKIYLLISREYINDKYNGGLWSEFGGSKHKGETFMDTAIREGFEESAGLLGSFSEIALIIKNKTVLQVPIRDEYVSFLVRIDYDRDLPRKFRQHFLQVKKNNPELINKNGLYEKDMLRWIEYSKLEMNYDIFRKSYKGIVKKLISLNLYDSIKLD